MESVMPSGYATRLEGYDFSTNRVEYRLPKSIADHKLVRALPKAVRQWLPLSKPQMRTFTRPPFPDEPVLSAAFTIHLPASANAPALRIVSADENGNEF